MRSIKTILCLNFLFAIITLNYGQFIEQTDIIFGDFNNPSAAWGDYDNDGDYDVVLSGNTIVGGINTKLFLNNGSNTFSEQTDIIFDYIIGNLILFGDNDNDGDLDILIAGRSYTSTYKTTIYQNNGSNSFTELSELNLQGIDDGSADWADFDNDGDLDILLSGISDQGHITELYYNNGNNTYNLSNMYFTEIWNSDISSGDYDNDGDLDILIAGETDQSGLITKVYRNDGYNKFAELTNLILDKVKYSSVAWGDYDNDGDLDILLSGYIYDKPITKIYKNVNINEFLEQTDITLAGVYNGSVAWGDYDNDSDLDILLSGTIDNGNKITQIFRNDNNNFIKQTSIALSGISDGKAIWIDYDSDKDLDIFLSGSYGSSNFTKIYKNNLNNTPSLPYSPSQLNDTIIDNNKILIWNRLENDSIPDYSITYNLRVGSTSNGCEIVSPHSNSDGTMILPKMGNVQTDTFFILRNLKKGTYYWSVQAVDNAFNGGPFASEDSFTFENEIQASYITFYNNVGTSMKVHWQRGNGDSCIVFIKVNASDSANPINNTTYIANSMFGSGSQIETSNWYCAYKGINNEVTISNLTMYARYTVQVFEYTGNSGNENYFRSKGDNNPSSSQNSQFTEQPIINFTRLYDGSTAWGDYDNDRDLDIIMTGSGDVYIEKPLIYKNIGDNSFIGQTNINLMDLNNSNVELADFNNDGDLDILLSGYYGYGAEAYTKVYENNGNNSYSEVLSIAIANCSWGDIDNDGDLDILNPYWIYINNLDHSFSLIPGIQTYGQIQSSDWGDYDNDDDLDIILNMEYNYKYYTYIYQNDGDNEFTIQSEVTLPGLWDCSFAWGDFNNDGYLDILLSGNTENEAITRIYRNNQNNTFTFLNNSPLIGVYEGSVAWGDYDNDGMLDAFVCGKTISEKNVTKIYRNQGNETFIESTDIYLTGVYNSSFSLGDYDNDDDLDILLTGISDSTYITKLYKNNTILINEPPTIPQKLYDTVIDNEIFLKWSAISNDEPVSYNLRVGASTGSIDVVSPHSLLDGTRLISKMGNAQTDTSFMLKNLKIGKYYWSVQSIDNSFIASEFAVEDSFYFDREVQSHNIKFDSVSGNSMVVKWQRGNGEKCLVFMKESTSANVNPVDSFTYISNSLFGFGGQIDSSGWYCVYNGTKNRVLVSNLKGYTNYTVKVFEYSGEIDSQHYYTSLGNENPNNKRTLQFSEVTAASLPIVMEGSTSIGDYDNDSDFDLLITGYYSSNTLTKIIRNNGSFNFSTQGNIILPGVTFSSQEWADYDNDGDLDFSLTGDKLGGLPYNRMSKIYMNNGNNSFTDQTDIKLTNVNGGSLAWGDYDNDGDLDLLLNGAIGDYNFITKIYRNNGNNILIEDENVILPGLVSSSVKWVDYDNDGDLDIHLSGFTMNGTINALYKNEGNRVFIEQKNIILPKVYFSSTDWGDYDNDGDLDILISGATSNDNYITEVFKNEGNNSFIEQNDISLLGIRHSNVSWGDYDNDGNLDILISGEANVNIGNIIRIYRNNGLNSFMEDKDFSLPYKYSSYKAKWCDFDNDNDLDILLTGGGSTKIYRNDISNSNNNPDAPTGLTSVVTGKEVLLKWNSVTNDETYSKGINYNVRVGTTPNGNEIVTSHSNSDGKRLLIDKGNGQLDTTFILNGLNKGKYYWSVQAIDAGFLGSEFASESEFTIEVSSFVQNTEKPLIEVFPNPSNGIVYLKTDVEGILNIRNILGKLVLVKKIENKETEIDLSNENSGIYTFEYINEDKSNVIKVILK